MTQLNLPELLAPAGDISSFLAAMAAGADAAYIGLKNFSARVGAENFSITDLARMVDLAEQNDRKVYVAFNTMLKSSELLPVGRLIKRLQRDARPHALIIQDIGLIDIARQAGYDGELHLSTLSNISSSRDLFVLRDRGVQRVVLPRELSIDEIRQMDQEAPDGISFELFIHGALCWCVSGRCYWSSYLGGKSGLRGRCVQPCRRLYMQKGREGRFFSCQDLSLDVLVKTLIDIPHVRSLKIEGRKKGPHYVYHVVAAYRMLLDTLGANEWVHAKKDAEALLEMALGRSSTRARFLPQKEARISAPTESTSSGMLVGKIQFSKKIGTAQPFIKPRIDLLPQDLLRIGYEDEPWHDTVSVTRRTPKAGSYTLSLDKNRMPKTGVPVFLIDRREPELVHILHEWRQKLENCRSVESPLVDWSPRLPAPARGKRQQDYLVRSSLLRGKETRASRSIITALWMSPNTVRAVSHTVMPRISWWLPPVIWPEEDALWQRLVLEALRGGATRFVCNSPWQISFFSLSRERRKLHITAGPFCNIANAAAVAQLASLGFSDAFVSPELSRNDFLSLPVQSCLPLGMILSGFWPVGISRHALNLVKANELFYSPKRESFWARNYGHTLWIYPGWPLDLSAHRQELESAGYNFFATLEENPPQGMLLRRTSEFNWNSALL